MGRLFHLLISFFSELTSESKSAIKLQSALSHTITGYGGFQLSSWPMYIFLLPHNGHGLIFFCILSFLCYTIYVKLSSLKDYHNEGVLKCSPIVVIRSIITLNRQSKFYLLQLDIHLYHQKNRLKLDV